MKNVKNTDLQFWGGTDITKVFFTPEHVLSTLVDVFRNASESTAADIVNHYLLYGNLCNIPTFVDLLADVDQPFAVSVSDLKLKENSNFFSPIKNMIDKTKLIFYCYILAYFSYILTYIYIQHINNNIIL